MVKYLLVKLLDRASISISIDSDQGVFQQFDAVRSVSELKWHVCPVCWHIRHIYIYTTGYILNASVYYIYAISAYNMCKACGMPLDCG